MTSFFLPLYVILNQMSTYPVSTKIFHCFVLLWFGQEMWTWETLDVEILCGCFAHQISSPHQTLLNSLSFSVALIIFQWMLL